MNKSMKGAAKILRNSFQSSQDLGTCSTQDHIINTVSQLNIVSWNTRCRSRGRIKPINNYLTNVNSRSIVAFQEVPKWISMTLRNGGTFCQ